MFSGPLDRSLTSGRIIETKPGFDLLIFLSFLSRTASERNEISSKTHQRARRDSTGQRLRDSHHPHVRVDRTIERKIFSERVDEHQRVVHVSTNHRLFRARLRKAKTPFCIWIQLATEDRFRKQTT